MLEIKKDGEEFPVYKPGGSYGNDLLPDIVDIRSTHSLPRTCKQIRRFEQRLCIKAVFHFKRIVT